MDSRPPFWWIGLFASPGGLLMPPWQSFWWRCWWCFRWCGFLDGG